MEITFNGKKVKSIRFSSYAYVQDENLEVEIETMLDDDGVGETYNGTLVGKR